MKPNTSTAMTAAFEKAGIDKDAMRLAALVHGLIKSGKPAEQQELEIGHALLTDKGMLRAMVRFYRRALAPDELPGKGHLRFDTQPACAQPRQPQEGEGGHATSDAQDEVASPPSPDDGGGGHMTVDTQKEVAPAAVAPREPSATAVAARGRAAVVIALSVLDTDRLGNGQIVGRLYYSSLPRLRTQSAYDAALLQLIMNYGTPPKGDMQIKDYIPVEHYQRMKQKAAEMANAV